LILCKTYDEVLAAQSERLGGRRSARVRHVSVRHASSCAITRLPQHALYNHFVDVCQSIIRNRTPTD
jgi:hypothetical protein